MMCFALLCVCVYLVCDWLRLLYMWKYSSHSIWRKKLAIISNISFPSPPGTPSETVFGLWYCPVRDYFAMVWSLFPLFVCSYGCAVHSIPWYFLIVDTVFSVSRSCTDFFFTLLRILLLLCSCFSLNNWIHSWWLHHRPRLPVALSLASMVLYDIH